ncbi:WXG100 family type VII secretion target [Mycolicibacterium wolinskyi]|uniref:ESAT-6-like protein n=1 Tax=Mycolicibacterium wolinskyi TaxID=59750 RepID=A0A1X2ESE3_9MYCO|nr:MULTISPECIES: WXG100 family type VII secretion target [Mycolicibacterium]MCV7288947.1 WXG100 family type VII secretion target [Mycolicibacterium wolinskyi]MCV7296984.1 WXG100 family type VII secretion target [Mycolicibacterium goodii]ORX09112.1 hypothetical protein AWC31_09135 [Mycolicibacterium wolinskyi]
MLVFDFPQLQSAITHMVAFQRDVEASLEDIDQAMAALRQHWHGSGSDAQAQAQQQWEDGAEQMRAALSQLQKAAEAAHKNYTEAKKKNGEMWAP